MLDNRTVGRSIAALRQANGMTQQKLAATMNVSHQAVSKWENGAALPDMQTMLDLSRLFGVTMEQLLLGEVPEERLKSREEEEKKPQLSDFQLPDFNLRGAVKDVVNGIGSLFKAPEPIVSREDEEIANTAAYEEAIELEVEAAYEEAIEREVEASVSEAMDDGALTALIEHEVEAAVSEAMDDAAIEATTEREVEEAVLSPEECEDECNDEQIEQVEATEEAEEDLIDIARLCQMAPFMSIEALDELVRQYKGKMPASSIVRLAPFVSRGCLEEMIWQLDGTTDWNILHKIAPFVGRETLDKLVKEYRGKVPMENIVRLAPFISKECLEELIWKVDGTLDWEMLRKFAPFLGRQAVDRMALAIAKGEKLVRPAVENTVKAAEDMGKTIQKKVGEVDWNEIGGKISDLGGRIGSEVDKAVRGAMKFGESVVREVGKAFESEKTEPEKKPSSRAHEVRRRMFERAMQDDKWDWIAERIDDLDDEVLKDEIISRAAELGMTDWLSENVDGYISNEMVRNALAEKNWIWLSANLDEIDEAMHEEIVRAATAERNWNWLGANLHRFGEDLHELIAREAVEKDGFGFLVVNGANLELGSAALEIAIEAVRASRGDVAAMIVEEHLNEEEALAVALAAIDTACEDKVLWIAEHLDAAGINELCVELAEKEKWQLLEMVIEHAEETTVDAVCMKLAVKGAWKQVEKLVQNASEDAVAQMMDMAVDAGDWPAIEMLEEYMG